jgi:ABC-type phosphate transport system substrate-binding protein
LQALSSRVHSLSVDGAEPTLANIAGKRYPLERPVYLVSPLKPSADLAEFTGYLRGSDAHRIFEKYLVTQ